MTRIYHPDDVTIIKDADGVIAGYVVPDDGPDAYEPDPCPRCGADLNESRHYDAHMWEGGCPD